MNIFVLDYDPVRASKMHCDSHCNKMIIESAQMLSTASHYAVGKLVFRPNPATGKRGYLIRGTLSRIYAVDKKHVFHPYTQWSLASRKSFEWLVELAFALHDEKVYRYGSGNKSIRVVERCAKYAKYLDENPMPHFPLAMPEQYHIGNAVESYREFYINDKAHLLTYTKRKPPKWLVPHFNWVDK